MAFAANTQIGSHPAQGEKLAQDTFVLEAKLLEDSLSFAPASMEMWQGLVGKILARDAKKPTLDNYAQTTLDGVTIAPFYEGAQDAEPLIRKATALARFARIDAPRADVSKHLVDAALLGGANALQLVGDTHPLNFGFGVALDERCFATLLDGVDLELGISLDIQQGESDVAASFALSDYLKGRRVNQSLFQAHLGLDPLTLYAARGDDRVLEAKSLFDLTKRGKEAADQGFKGTLFACDGRLVHASCGSDAQELGFVLASALTYLRLLEAAGFSRSEARSKLLFRLTLDADVLLNVAKQRALRLCFARIEEALGLSSQPLALHCETAWRTLSAADPWSNLLRASLASLAAMLGGADGLSILPFSQAQGLPDDFARRLARNTALILEEESHLTFVTDPLAGAGSVEELTMALAKAAWGEMQRLEAARQDDETGLIAALKLGEFQSNVHAMRKKREADIASGKILLVGGNAYPAPDELLRAKPHCLIEAIQYNQEDLPTHRLRPYRLLAKLEAASAKQNGGNV